MDSKPRLFIGSSSEGLAFAKGLATQLHSVADVRVWTDVFDLGNTTIEALYREANLCDFAVLIVTHDDLVDSRGKEQIAPRDNVIFEAGLFMGRLGRRRTILLCDTKAQLKLPSDLSGVTMATFTSDVSDPVPSLETASRRIADIIMTRTQYEGEVDFIRAYLTFISPEFELSNTYADILTHHYTLIQTEVENLKQSQDWQKLLQVKQRLREYFEFSGKYLDGARFGQGYVIALRNLGQVDEAAWAQIKDVGYMLILDGRHKDGRKVILDTIQSVARASKNVDDTSRAKLLFYAHRYLGISFQRDRLSGSLTKASSHFHAAEEQLTFFACDSETLKELRARLLRNLAHLALEQREFKKAISNYRESLEMFQSIPDPEHIGIGHLSLAKALIVQMPEAEEDPITHLRKAETIFSRLGWIEGQGRVFEQYALYYRHLAEQAEDIDAAKRRLTDALAAAENSRSMFERLRSGRWLGRIDALREELQKLEASLAERRHLQSSRDN